MFFLYYLFFPPQQQQKKERKKCFLSSTKINMFFSNPTLPTPTPFVKQWTLFQKLEEKGCEKKNRRKKRAVFPLWKVKKKSPLLSDGCLGGGILALFRKRPPPAATSLSTGLRQCSKPITVAPGFVRVPASPLHLLHPASCDFTPMQTLARKAVPPPPQPAADAKKQKRGPS